MGAIFAHLRTQSKKQRTGSGPLLGAELLAKNDRPAEGYLIISARRYLKILIRAWNYISGRIDDPLEFRSRRILFECAGQRSPWETLTVNLLAIYLTFSSEMVSRQLWTTLEPKLGQQTAAKLRECSGCVDISLRDSSWGRVVFPHVDVFCTGCEM